MFSGHNDWQHPDGCEMLMVVMLHSERYPRGGIVVEKTVRRESIT